MNTQTLHYLTQDELKALFKAISLKRDQALFLLAYRYGLRASEIGQLRKDDLDFTRLKIRINRLKGSISSEYPLQPDIARSLKSYLRTREDNTPILFPSKQGGPINRRTLDYLMKKYGAEAGTPLKKRHFHTLKHSIATHLLDAGADIMFVKDWLGHKNIQNTMVYAQLTNRTREEQARRVFASPRVV
jgi:type 1 fimbriae regulatory protein FimB